MPRIPLILLPALACLVDLAACAPSEPEARTLAFAGSWNCQGVVLTFTDTTFNNGVRTQPIKVVSARGRDYSIYLADGTRIGLAAVTETGLTWVSDTTGDQFTCLRVN